MNVESSVADPELVPVGSGKIPDLDPDPLSIKRPL